MLFNSIDFTFFMPIVFLIYWALGYYVKAKNISPLPQNLFLLAASYFFYAWWDWRFLSLIVICSLTNYGAGLLLMKNDSNDNDRLSKFQKLEKSNARKTILTLCCVVCFGILGVFKYYDFFAAQLIRILPPPHNYLNIRLLHLILPVGISFYTFHTLSYTIDVYSRKFEPTRDITSFFLFVSIFPLAMAGPIERATNLLPQIYKRRTFDYAQATDGMRQILWGLFKKVVIADNCAVYVNQIFDTYLTQTGSALLLGAIFFAFQIYGDFSGYSDMAIGIGKLLGFKFLNNFRFPYFSRDIAEFWRRWHISLNTWFRDYLYIPLGGSRGTKWLVVRNTFIIFLVSGFWHGANWTFIAWGAFHAVLFLPLILLDKNRKNTDTVAENRILPSLKELFQMGLTFGLVVIGWVFFRAESIHQALEYLSGICSSSLFGLPHTQPRIPISIYLFIMLLLGVEWVQRNKQHGLESFGLKWNKWLRYTFYFIIAFIIVLYSLEGTPSEFIYFQF
ncbi:O-acyltransferase [Bacteroidia bacterium]|nr:O-acyltransferase [Bacteroidia bacterium]